MKLFHLSYFVLLLFLSVVIFSSCGSSSAADQGNATSTAIDPEMVRKLYHAKCSICHGADGKLGVANSKDLSLSVLNKEEVVAMIRYGKNTMPPQTTLTDEQVDALADFTLNLRPSH